MRPPQPPAQNRWPSAGPSAVPSARQRVRRWFPFVDGVTYAIAAGALAAVWVAAELLGSLGTHLAGAW